MPRRALAPPRLVEMIPVAGEEDGSDVEGRRQD